MCTGVRFSDNEGNMYFGRNLDWSFSYGETIGMRIGPNEIHIMARSEG